jgi:hypothetical protein
MLSTGRRRPNYALLQKVTIYSRLPEFAARRLKPVEFVLPTKRHDFKYKPPAKPAAKRAWPWYSPMQHYAKSDIASRIEG